MYDTIFEPINKIKQIKQRKQTEKIIFIESNNNNKTNDGNSSEDDELAEIHDNYLNSLIDAVNSVSIKEKDIEICETPENINIDSLEITSVAKSRKDSIENRNKLRHSRKDKIKNKRKINELRLGPLVLPDPNSFKIETHENNDENKYIEELIDDVKYFYAPLIKKNSINTCLFEQEIKRLLYDLLESYYINYKTDNKDRIYIAFNVLYDAMETSKQYDMDDLSNLKKNLDGLHNGNSFNPRFPEEPQTKRQRIGGKKKRKTKKLKKKAKTKKSKMKKIKRKTMKKKKSKKHKR